MRTIQTDLGTITHHYWMENGIYYRQLLDKLEHVQFWSGYNWVYRTNIKISTFRQAA
jgi:hypothetical protein